jgi:hypothetical protein
MLAALPVIVDKEHGLEGTVAQAPVALDHLILVQFAVKEGVKQRTALLIAERPQQPPQGKVVIPRLQSGFSPHTPGCAQTSRSCSSASRVLASAQAAARWRSCSS